MLFRFQLLVVWTPRTADTEDNGEEQQCSGGPHQYAYHHCQPLHLLLEQLILLCTAVLVEGGPATEHIDSLIIRGAVEAIVPLADTVDISRTILRPKNC